MTTYIAPQFYSVKRDFLTCRQVRDPLLANEWRKQKAEAIRLPLPALFGSRQIPPSVPVPVSYRDSRWILPSLRGSSF